MSRSSSALNSPEVPIPDLTGSEPAADLGNTTAETAAETAAQEHEEMPEFSESTTHDTSIQEDDIADMANNEAILSEFRASLHAISNGVNELSTTVQDLLGLSESDGNSSDDYGEDKFSWLRFKSNARRRRRQRLKANIDATRGKEHAPGHDAENDDEFWDKEPKIIPDVRECSLQEFYSCKASDGNKAYCVDVLIAGASFNQDIVDFRETLDKTRLGITESRKPDRVPIQTGEASSDESEKKWIRRIRINSRVVLTTIERLYPGTIDPYPADRPLVFQRPFQLLVSLHDKMAEELAIIKHQGLDSSSSSSRLDTRGSDLCPNRTEDTATPILDLDVNENAIEELTCFVVFMETRIMPDSRRYRQGSSSLPTTIRYEDLWYLFKPGDLIYYPRDTPGRDRNQSSPFSQSIVRVIHTRVCATSSPAPYGINWEMGRPWSILTHFIDHDGTSYAPVSYVIAGLFPFQGEKKVTELVAYPVWYIEDEKVMAQAISDGHNYVGLIERRSGFYSGWTQTTNPFGIPITKSSPGERLSSPEHIESDILVDFQETFNAFPTWRPLYYHTMPLESGFTADMIVPGPPELPMVLHREDSSQKICDYVEHFLHLDPTEKNEAKKLLEEDELGQFRPNMRHAPTGNFLALLPRRIFAYAVLQRRFVPVDPRFVRNSDLDTKDEAFGKLEIKRDYKRLILALVKSHFEKVETEKRTNVEIGTQDLIRGKGKGVVILLHGVPGVGKTATAEAVALKWKKPLFPITCGDLGYTAESLENSLNEIFRLAHHWGCILLLDEADVFITQRERHDLKRNALVSAFLRVLEYYNGIMFLTTNRAGVLDEAVKSRVHLSLHYGHLTESQTVAIFMQHIRRLNDIEKQRNPDPEEQILVRQNQILEFARDHFNEFGNDQGPGTNLGRWNGRQIKNAFLIASSMAHYDSEEEDNVGDVDELTRPRRKKQKQLGRREFELVARTTLLYDQYRQSVHSGKSDDHIAFEREERERPPQRRSATPVRLRNASGL